VRVLLVQLSLAPPGGGNAVAAWMLHALAGEHDLATLTLRDWPVAGTNAFFGTAIAPAAVTRHVTPAPWRYLAALPEDRGRYVALAALFRHARKLAGRYDLLITADNWGAFAKPGIQYLHYPLALTPRTANPLVTLYFGISNALAGVHRQLAAHNLTLANSEWTAAGLEREQGIRARVLYPPVLDPGEGLPWDERRNSVLCIGRFSGSKRIERAMAIVQRLRAHALPGARLIIVGSAVDREYTARLHRFAARDRDWIDIRENLSRADIDRLIGECRYGLQPAIDEHFGMATAEMARGGCLPFAHESGGSPEVLGGQRALLWQTDDDAVARISAVARDPSLSDELRWTLRRHTNRFSVERFADAFRTIVREWGSGQLAERRIV
jgi:glycosyltransferase involved in cell wall biosynthesis